MEEIQDALRNRLDIRKIVVDTKGDRVRDMLARMQRFLLTQIREC